MPFLRSLWAQLTSCEENDHLEKQVGSQSHLRVFFGFPALGTNEQQQGQRLGLLRGLPCQSKPVPCRVDQWWLAGLVRSLRTCHLQEGSPGGMESEGLWLSLLPPKVSLPHHVHRLPLSQDGLAPPNHRQVPLSGSVHADL